jgi:hypothetical protein
VIGLRNLAAAIANSFTSSGPNDAAAGYFILSRKEIGRRRNLLNRLSAPVNGEILNLVKSPGNGAHHTIGWESWRPRGSTPGR